VSIADVKRIPITDIAARLGITLDAHGKALCFRGHDTIPSLSFNIRGNYFRCFGCNIGGSGIDLVKEYLNITTGEAIKWIESQYHLEEKIALKRKKSPGGYKTITGAEKTSCKHDIEAWGHSTGKDGKQYADIYRQFIDLLPRTEAAEYLKNRGLTADLILKSDIRAIPKDFDYTPLKDRYGIETLLNAGLFAISKRTGTPYPVFFSHRLIIPYFDMDGKTIVLLQGRNIDSGDEPKYKFLPGIKTVVYNLRGIADAERSGKKVYITEGAIDCLSCYAAGMFHPIAIGGAMNKAIYEPEIFNRLGNLEVIIATDRDTAGQSFYRDFLKRYKDRFYTLPKVIDWDRIQGAKDINEALTAEIIPKQKTGKKRYRSEILNDIFTIEDNGGVLFESGVYYTPAELEKVKEFADSEKKTIHLLKKVFQGTIQ
jgi:DNA primase